MSAFNWIALVGTLVFSFAMDSRAQECEEQWLSMGSLSGSDGTVYAMERWDPDGPGPLAEMLVFGGRFEAIGSVLAVGIAAWDGNTWQSLGGGIPMDPQLAWIDVQVRAMTVFNGELIAAGVFHESSGAPSNAIARWNGVSWRSLGSAFEHDAEINALTVYDGKLIAGGRFSSVAGEACGNLAQWDGARWNAVPGGIVPVSYHSAKVLALEPCGGQLFVGGEFRMAGSTSAVNIASWDGLEWHALLEGLGGSVVALQERSGMLYVGGEFLQSGLPGSRNITMWDGTAWKELPSGLSSRKIYGLADSNMGLIVAGDMTFGASRESMGVVILDGTTWIGTGRVFPYARAVETLNGNVHAAGADMLRWNGNEWEPLTPGTDEIIRVVTSYGGTLAVAGDFLTIQGVKARRVALHDGETWVPLGNGANRYSVSTLYEFDGALLAGGRPGGITASGVSRWNGQAWEPMGEITQGTVRSLVVHAGRLYAAGQFLNSKGELTGGLMEWSGSRWRNSAANSGVEVFSIVVHEGVLYGAGDFVPDNIDEIRVARLQGGKWEQVGEPFPRASYRASLRSLVSHGSNLIYGGLFESDPGAMVDVLYSWDGTRWRPLPSAREHIRSINALAVFEGDLYASGYVTTSAGLWQRGIVRWDGIKWQDLQGPRALGTTLGASIWELHAHGESLFAAGRFDQIGGIISSNLAQWACPPCYADCDQSSGLEVLDIFDFLCFQNNFVGGEPYACDCDVSTGSSVCDVFDFLCFQNAFVAGCP